MLKSYHYWPLILGAFGASALVTSCVSGVAGVPDPDTQPRGTAGIGGPGMNVAGSGATAGGSNANAGGSSATSGGATGTGGGTGVIGAAGSSSAGGSNTVPAPSSLPGESACTVPGSPGPRVLRRLTAREFSASVSDLFADPTAPVAQVFNDPRVLGFTVDSSALLVQDLNADQLMTSAESVASWAVTSKLSQLTQLATCSSHDQNCANSLIKNFGRKAFRTAIPDGDSRIEAYGKLFMAEASFADGASSVIAAMLQSPHFLYRSEIGAPGASGSTINLTPYEVASSLSYLLTGSAPDDTLLKAADAVGTDPASLTKMVDEQATRLLGPSGGDQLPPAAQNSIMNFMSGWLGLDRLYTNVKDDNVQKLTAEQRADMAAETQKFILDVWGSSTNNTVSDLFSANYTFLNQNLASYYKLNADGLSSSFSKVMLPSGRDGGLLGHASLLVGYARSNLSSPTQRGHFVRSRLLCQDVPSPPPGLDTKFATSPNLKTTRQQYLEAHAAPDHQPCYACHKLMDPIGVAFEHYDAFGNYRTTENGETIDSTGTVYSMNASEADVHIDGLSGPKGLQTYLAESETVKQCLVRYWSYYAFGSVGWTQDGCTYDAIRAAAASQSYSLKSVLMAILHTPRFTTRSDAQ